MSPANRRMGEAILPAGMIEGPRLTDDGLVFCSQIAQDEVLFRRRNAEGEDTRDFIVYDTRRGAARHFDPPDTAIAALGQRHAGSVTLRRDGEGEGEAWFFCDGTVELRYIAPGGAKSAFFYAGVDDNGERRTFRIGTVFVARDRLMIVDPDRGCLLSLDKGAVMRALGETPLGGDWTPIDIGAPEFDQQPFPFGPAENEGAGIFSSFDGGTVFFAIQNDRTSMILHLSVHAFDMRSETISRHEWPVAGYPHLAQLHRIHGRGAVSFGAYLDALYAFSRAFEEHIWSTAGACELWLDGRIILFDGRTIEFGHAKSGRPDRGSARETGPSPLREAYSPIPAVQSRGIAGLLRGRGPMGISSLERYLVRRYGTDELAELLDPMIDPAAGDMELLLIIGRILYRTPERVDLGTRWLEGPPAKRWIAAGLLEGRVIRSDAERALEMRSDEGGPAAADLGEAYARPEDIPAEALRKAADEAAMAAGEATSPGRLREEPPGDSLILNLIKRILTTAVSWQTEEGMAIVRDLASRGIPEIDFLVADIIRDRRLSPLKDAARSYLGHRDAMVVKRAISALRDMEAREPEVEDGMIRLLGASDRGISVAASKALGEIGSERSMSALAYADIVECFLDEKRYEGDREPTWNPRTGSYAEGAMARILAELMRDLETYPPGRSKDPRREDKRRIFVGHTVLRCYRDACRNYGEMAPPKNNRLLRTKSHVEDIAMLDDLAGLRERWTVGSLAGLFPRRAGKARQVFEFLKWHLHSGDDADTLYLAALTFHLTPGYLSFRRFSPAMKDVAIVLEAIYARMSEEADHRGIFAVFALLELGVGRKWEQRALDVFARGDWRGWPRLMRVGIRALRHRPEEERLGLCAMLLADIGGGPGYEEALFDIAKEDPKVAVRLYERGTFKLDTVKAGLLYGLAGDMRGLRDMLKAPSNAHTRQSVEFMREHGGPEAEEVIERALDRWRSAGDVAKAILKELINE